MATTQNPSQQTRPRIVVNDITDVKTRENFKNLQDYFQQQNQLLDFKFFEVTFDKAQNNKKVAHGLSNIPVDLLVTKITGKGNVVFNTGLFDKTNMDITASDACKLRFFAGTYWNSQSTAQDDKTTQVAYNTAASTINPPGVIVAFGGAKVPDGWLLCDGTAYNIADYASLAAALLDSGSQKYLHGGNQTQFNVPDLRGRFLRGLDPTNKVDPDAQTRAASTNGGLGGANVGSLQNDAVQDHRHTWKYFVTTNGGGGASYINAPRNDAGTNTEDTAYSGKVFPNKDASAVALPLARAPQVSSETRPVNMACNFIIKT